MSEEKKTVKLTSAEFGEMSVGMADQMSTVGAARHHVAAYYDIAEALAKGTLVILPVPSAKPAAPLPKASDPVPPKTPATRAKPKRARV